MGKIEERSRLNMYAYIGEWINKFYDDVGKRNVGGLLDQTSNFYNRISGTYNISIANRTTHSMIACIPITMNVTKKVGKWRGTCSRGTIVSAGLITHVLLLTNLIC